MDVPFASSNVGLLASTLRQETLDAKVVTKALDYSSHNLPPRSTLAADQTALELNARAIEAVLTGKGTLLDVIV